MNNPRVSFIVPCYKLAHLLGECIQSILAQSYEDFEIIVMDDCSPDNTGEVAQSFGDSRIRYIRNNPNLGHLRNYNKGIDLSRGAFVWLISADDCLASSRVLERYMDVLDRNPKVGYAFCPALTRVGDKRGGVAEYTNHGTEDTVFDGRDFLRKTLLKSNGIAAASGLVRKTCYEQISVFPLDMPYGGDWYLWSLFALHHDVAYFHEPMVEYRTHEQAITAIMSQENVRKCINDDLVLHWRIAKEAEKLGLADIVKICREECAQQFGRYIAGISIRGTVAEISVDEMRKRLCEMTADEHQRKEIASSALARAGDLLFWRGDYPRAAAAYELALKERRFWPAVWGRAALASTNGLGALSRKAFFSLRQMRRA